MKKYLALLIVFSMMLMVSLSFVLAQTPRDEDDTALGERLTPGEGKTSFTNLSVRGLNVDGVPGYIEMVSSAGRIYYLYFADDGTLKQASPSQVATTASPNVTDWNNAGVRIGGQ